MSTYDVAEIAHLRSLESLVAEIAHLRCRSWLEFSRREEVRTVKIGFQISVTRFREEERDEGYFCPNRIMFGPDGYFLNIWKHKLVFKSPIRKLARYLMDPKLNLILENLRK